MMRSLSIWLLVTCLIGVFVLRQVAVHPPARHSRMTQLVSNVPVDLGSMAHGLLHLKRRPSRRECLAPALVARFVLAAFTASAPALLLVHDLVPWAPGAEPPLRPPSS